MEKNAERAETSHTPGIYGRISGTLMEKLGTAIKSCNFSMDLLRIPCFFGRISASLVTSPNLYPKNDCISRLIW